MQHSNEVRTLDKHEHVQLDHLLPQGCRENKQTLLSRFLHLQGEHIETYDESSLPTPKCHHFLMGEGGKFPAY